MKLRTLAVTALAVAGLIAGCGPGSSSSSGTIAKVHCGVAIAEWYKHGGKTDVVVLQRQFKPLVAASRSHQKGTIRKDAAGVEAAANTLKSHEPPNCVPSADPDLSKALTDVSNAAKAATAQNVSGVKSSLRQADGSLKNVITDVRVYVKR